jgi:hypothetical protein
MTGASWLTGGLSAEAVESYARLVSQLARLADQGETPPCTHPLRWAWWTSDDADEREAATHACTSCPLLDTCTAHAPHEPAHVWGVDRSPTTRNAQ